MAIIDSQVHCYEANTPKRPWHSVPNWPDHATGDEMVAAMDRVGVEGSSVRLARTGKTTGWPPVSVAGSRSRVLSR